MIKKWASYNLETNETCYTNTPIHFNQFIEECNLQQEKSINVIIATSHDKLESILKITPKERFKGVK